MATTKEQDRIKSLLSVETHGGFCPVLAHFSFTRVHHESAGQTGKM